MTNKLFIYNSIQKEEIGHHLYKVRQSFWANLPEVRFMIKKPACGQKEEKETGEASFGHPTDGRRSVYMIEDFPKIVK